MRYKLLLLFLLSTSVCFGQQKAVNIIFDSDMGPDYDDVGAITILHTLADKGEAHILATVASTRYDGVAGVMNVFNTLDVKHTDSSSKNSWSWIYSNNYKPVVKAELVSKNTMPDVRAMTMKDALYLLENMNIKVIVKGRGKVVAQDVLAGTAINKNQTVTLLLN